MRGIMKGPPPKDVRDWDRSFRSLNEHVKSDEHVAYLVSDTVALTTRPDTRLATIMQHLGDAGRATSQRLLGMVTVGNLGSAQSVQPLTAVSDTATSEISIAGHILHMDFGDTAYNSGSIAGLTPSTQYYIYADDPEFEGGAVSYLATTDPTRNVVNSGRYRVGAIMTPGPFSSAVVAAVTQANPGQVTTLAPHGFSTGFDISFAGIVGMTELNGNTYTITMLDPSNFTIPVDTTGFTLYVSGGVATHTTSASTGSGGGGGGGGGVTWPP